MYNNVKWDGKYLLLYNKDGEHLMYSNVKWDGNY
jgi:hypothetical protein